MAHANNSILTGKFRGSIGKELVFREWDGKTVVAKSPKRRSGDPTQAQADLQDKFQMASQYAKAVLTSADQSMAEAYADSLKPRQNVYSRALEDFMTSPVIKKIDTHKYNGAVGDTIVIRAKDDFRVTGVHVEIYNASGALVEKGDAVQIINGIDWTYTAGQANSLPAGCKVKVTAFDIPGNEGSLEQVL